MAKKSKTMLIKLNEKNTAAMRALLPFTPSGSVAREVNLLVTTYFDKYANNVQRYFGRTSQGMGDRNPDTDRARVA